MEKFRIIMGTINRLKIKKKNQIIKRMAMAMMRTKLMIKKKMQKKKMARI
jgi:hypothetical protein